MNIVELIDPILHFISRWLGTTLPRILVAFIGLLSLFLGIVTWWDRRVKPFYSIMGAFIGLFLILFALKPGIIYFLAKTDPFIRVRTLMILFSLLVILITIEAIRRSQLRERYAILWVATSGIILAVAFFPQILNLFRAVLGTDYVSLVMGIVFTFLLLIAFHFSISLSRHQKSQSQIAQRHALLEIEVQKLRQKLEEGRGEETREQPGRKTPYRTSVEYEPERPVSKGEPKPRPLRGTQVAVPITIAAVTAAALIIGWLTPKPMVGDEVTHYYMLAKQSEYLSRANFFAEIATGYGEIEHRCYPHSFLWHYLGALVYRVTGGNFYFIQLYQALFWGQLLVFAYLLAKSRGGIENRSAMLYIIFVASLPVAVIFSVVFYQDLPMTAQIMTCFYFLRKRRWYLSVFFLCLAIGFKITALLFAPPYIILSAIWNFRFNRKTAAVVHVSVSILIVFTFTWILGDMIQRGSGVRFYPIAAVQKIIHKIENYYFDEGVDSTSDTAEISSQGNKQAGRTAVQKIIHKIENYYFDEGVDSTSDTAEISSQGNKQAGRTDGVRKVTPYEVEIIANHPGDLRIPENYFVYGGGVLWIVLLMGILSFVWGKVGTNRKGPDESQSGGWLLFVGLSYILSAAFFLWTAPDARFFLPGILFVILPFIESTVQLPRPKLIISTIAAIAVLQGGYVFAKVYQLRRVTPEIQSAIRYFEKNPPSRPYIFMYPEGNYRLFPVRHIWYLKYRLREFWKADNDIRIQMLQDVEVGAVVVKKHLIAEAAPGFINLGIYPTGFVKDLRVDPRFKIVLENDGVVIFKVPAIPAETNMD